MTFEHVIWRFKSIPKACLLEGLSNYDDSDELMYGLPQMKKFPKAAAFRMDRDSPRDTRLIDCVENINRLIVASPRLRTFLENAALPKVEYLAVTIFDHKKKIAAKDYAIVHPIDPVDCIDLKRSKITWDTIDTEYIAVIEDLIIDESKIEPKRRIFRLKHRSSMILAHRSLAEEVLESGVEGVEFMEIPDYFD